VQKSTEVGTLRPASRTRPPVAEGSVDDQPFLHKESNVHQV